MPGQPPIAEALDSLRSRHGRKLQPSERVRFRNAAGRSASRGATLAAIASEAGVSTSAVSKVLNGRTDVAADTRERVSRLLRQHGYRVASQVGFAVVDLLIFGLHNPWAEELIRGTVEAAEEADVSVIVTTVASPAEFSRWLDRASGRGTGGALCALHLPGSEHLRQLAGAKIPLVLIDPPEEPEPGVRSVGTTNWLGGLLATRHLIDLGHERIAVVGEDRLWSGLARLAGHRAAMLDAGIDMDSQLMRHAGFSVTGGRDQARQLLALRRPPTAVVAGNDAQAFGALQAIWERGLRTPDDISVVGFDDVPVAAWATPALTTVRQPVAAMAAAAFRMLYANPGGISEPHHIELATTLVVRESTAPPRR